MPDVADWRFSRGSDRPSLSGVIANGGKERGRRECGEVCVPPGGRAEDAASGPALFVESWLGPLIAYDAREPAELTATLAEFLEHHCDLDVTASALGIHRSTLRYRLFRIRQLTGYDIQRPDTRSNLLRATRAWRPS
jgi:hypothetical protein